MRSAIFKVFSALFFLITPLIAEAGYIEIGASGSYRRSNIAIDAYDESVSLTGSFSYYLNDASAIEVSYTDGRNKRAISENSENGHLTHLFYKTAGLDFVYTFGDRSATLRPYVKAGVNYILTKRIVDQIRTGGTYWEANVVEDSPGMVPSAGFGFKLGLTERVSLKVGVDAWTSRPTSEEPRTIDYFGRAGLSWFF